MMLIMQRDLFYKWFKSEDQTIFNLDVKLGLFYQNYCIIKYKTNYLIKL
jgi:hypothetical protein